MADIAELGYRVDSSGLVEGTKALDENVVAAERATSAAEKMGEAQKEASKTASFWANEQAKINARVQEMQKIEERAALATQQASRASELRELNLQKLLGQIDPTVAALNRLADMEDRLAKARDLGALKPEVWEQYQSQIEAARIRTLELARGSDRLSQSFGGLNLESSRTRVTMAGLARNLGSGNLGGAMSSLTTLSMGAGAAVGVVTMAVAGLGVVSAKGYMELRQLDAQMIAIGNTAGGALAGGLLNARNQIGGLIGDYGKAREAISAVVSSGQYASETAQSIATSAAIISDMTGKSVQSAVAEIQALAEGGTDALLKLDRQYGFLTESSYRQIQAIREEKGEAAAYQATVIELERVQRDRIEKMKESAGSLERAWDRAAQRGRDLIQAFKDIGRQDIEHRLQEAIKEMNAASSWKGLRGPDGVSVYATAQAKVAKLLAERMDMQDKEYYEERNRRREQDIRDVDAANELERRSATETLESRLAGLDRETAKLKARNEIIALYNKLNINDPRHFDGSMNRLIAQAEADIDRRFSRKGGRGSSGSSGVDSLLSRIRQQVLANEELARSGERVSASQRLVDEIDQKLYGGKVKLTAAERALLTAERERLAVSHDMATAAQQNERDLSARAALTERLAQLEKQRRDQASLDLMGMGLGSDATQALQRQLDIQRQYFDELERLKKSQRGPSPLSASEYEREVAQIQASLDRALGIERNYQQQRMAMLGEWRIGVAGAWSDYVFQAQDAMTQANGFVSNSLSGWEDAWVQMAKTGKLSFSSMIDGMIADLARYAAKQAAVGLFGNMMGGLFGGAVGPVQREIIPLSYGGGRAAGGTARSGSFYEVGEGGRPELFKQNGKQYLIPGNTGRVIPAAPVAGGGGATAPTKVNVTIKNAPVGTSGEASVRQGPGGEMNIEVLLKQVDQYIGGNIANGTGATYAAQKSRFGLQEAL